MEEAQRQSSQKILSSRKSQNQLEKTRLVKVEETIEIEVEASWCLVVDGIEKYWGLKRGAGFGSRESGWG